MTRVAQSQNDLMMHLVEQLVFLRNSIELYDREIEMEAKRLAAVIRTLVHDGKSTTTRSLLGQLEVKDAIQFVHVAGLENDGLDPTVFMGIPVVGTYSGGLKFEASLGDEIRKSSFAEWWAGSLWISKASDLDFTRRDFILEVAETDGGVHVDAKLKQDYYKLTREGGGWQIENTAANPFENSPALAAVRTIAHEVELSLKPYISAKVRYGALAYTHARFPSSDPDPENLI